METNNIIDQNQDLAEQLRQKMPISPENIDPNRGRGEIDSSIDREAMQGLGYLD